MMRSATACCRAQTGSCDRRGLLTRAQMAAVINRAFGAYETADLSAYTDVPSTAWYYKDMAMAVKMGTFCGDDTGVLHPDDYITREEVFTVIARAIKLSGGSVSALGHFSDRAGISSWASDALASLAEEGYIGGLGGKLKPGALISREEFAQVMDNVINIYIHKQGIYTQTVTGNVMIKASGVTLENMTVPGDVFVGEGVADGRVELNGINVEGRLVVRGGGRKDGITVTGHSVIPEIVVFDQNGVSIDVSKDADVDRILVQSANTSIETQSAEVVVAPPCQWVRP